MARSGRSGMSANRSANRGKADSICEAPGDRRGV